MIRRLGGPRLRIRTAELGLFFSNYAQYAGPPDGIRRRYYSSPHPTRPFIPVSPVQHALTRFSNDLQHRDSEEKTERLQARQDWLPDLPLQVCGTGSLCDFEAPSGLA